MAPGAKSTPKSTPRASTRASSRKPSTPAIPSSRLKPSQTPKSSSRRPINTPVIPKQSQTKKKSSKEELYDAIKALQQVLIEEDEVDEEEDEVDDDEKKVEGDKATNGRSVNEKQSKSYSEVMEDGMKYHQQFFDRPNITPDTAKQLVLWLEGYFREAIIKRVSVQSILEYLYRYLVHALSVAEPFLRAAETETQTQNDSLKPLSAPRQKLEWIGKVIGPIAEIIITVLLSVEFTPDIHSLFFTSEWVKLLVDILYASQGGSCFGSESTEALAEFLSLMVTDPAKSIARDLVQDDEIVGLTKFGGLLLASSTVNLSQTLVDAIVACVPISKSDEIIKDALRKTFGPHMRDWESGLFVKLCQLVHAAAKGASRGPKAMMRILNILAEGRDRIGWRPRGFQVLSAWLNKKDDLLGSSKSQERLELGDIILYTNPDGLSMRVFEQDGFLTDLSMLYDSMKGLHEAPPKSGKITYFKILGESAGILRFDLGLQPEDVKAFFQAVEDRVGSVAYDSMIEPLPRPPSKISSQGGKGAQHQMENDGVKLHKALSGDRPADPSHLETKKEVSMTANSQLQEPVEEPRTTKELVPSSSSLNKSNLSKISDSQATQSQDKALSAIPPGTQSEVKVDAVDKRDSPDVFGPVSHVIPNGHAAINDRTTRRATQIPLSQEQGIRNQRLRRDIAHDISSTGEQSSYPHIEAQTNTPSAIIPSEPVSRSSMSSIHQPHSNVTSIHRGLVSQFATNASEQASADKTRDAETVPPEHSVQQATAMVKAMTANPKPTAAISSDTTEPARLLARAEGSLTAEELVKLRKLLSVVPDESQDNAPTRVHISASSLEIPPKIDVIDGRPSDRKDPAVMVATKQPDEVEVQRQRSLVQPPADIAASKRVAVETGEVSADAEATDDIEEDEEDEKEQVAEKKSQMAGRSNDIYLKAQPISVSKRATQPQKEQPAVTTSVARPVKRKYGDDAAPAGEKGKQRKTVSTYHLEKTHRNDVLDQSEEFMNDFIATFANAILMICAQITETVKKQVMRRLKFSDEDAFDAFIAASSRSRAIADGFARDSADIKETVVTSRLDSERKYNEFALLLQKFDTDREEIDRLKQEMIQEWAKGQQELYKQGLFEQ